MLAIRIFTILRQRHYTPALFRTSSCATPPRIFFSPLHSNGHARCPLRCAVARFRAPWPARGSGHISHQQNRTGYRGAAMETYGARSAPTGQSLCESYFGITGVDGGGVHTPHARERWPAIASGSWRERPDHINPEMPIGCDPSSIRWYEWRRQKARRDITTQSPSCVGILHLDNVGGCELMRTGAGHQRFIATIWSVRWRVSRRCSQTSDTFGNTA